MTLIFILGQSHFIKTVEDIHEALVQSVPGVKFSLDPRPHGNRASHARQRHSQGRCPSRLPGIVTQAGEAVAIQSHGMSRSNVLASFDARAFRFRLFPGPYLAVLS
jgi:hypothetical protein